MGIYGYVHIGIGGDLRDPRVSILEVLHFPPFEDESIGFIENKTMNKR